MIYYYRKLKGLVENHKLPIPQLEARILLKEIKEYLAHAFKQNQSTR